MRKQIKHGLYVTTAKRSLHITALSLCFCNVITFVVAGCITLALKCVGTNSDEVDQIPW